MNSPNINNPPGKPVLRRLQHAARMLRVDSKWLRAEAEAGRVPGLFMGRTWVFDVDAVERVIAERAGKPNPIIAKTLNPDAAPVEPPPGKAGGR